MKKIVIIGAGVVGLNSALYALEEGFEVILIDKNKEPSQETSLQNGAQLSFTHIHPMLYSFSILELIYAVFSRKRAIVLDWKSFFKIIKCFIAKFLFSKKRDFFKFSYAGREEFLKVAKKIGIAEQDYSKGIIHIFKKNKKFKQYLHLLQGQKYFSYDILDKKQIEKELPNINANFALLCMDDFCLDTQIFTKKIYAYLLKNKNFSFLGEKKAKSFKLIDKNISKVLLDSGDSVDCDYCVDATGTMFFKNEDLLRAKGYSVNLKLDNDLQYGIIDGENKLVYSPLKKKLRVAGFYDFSFSKKTEKYRKKFFLNKLPKNTEDVEVWEGVRTLSKDGFPVIEQDKKIKNLYFNLGHSNLGWTLSFISAKILIEKIKQRK